MEKLENFIGKDFDQIAANFKILLFELDQKLIILIESILKYEVIRNVIFVLGFLILLKYIFNKYKFVFYNSNSPKYWKRVTQSIISRDIAKGKDYTRPDKYGYTGIMVGIRYCDDIEILKKVFESGINVNYSEHAFETCLSLAVKREEIPFINYLFEKGAQLDKSDDYRKNTLLNAADTVQNIEVFDTLIENGASLNDKSSSNVTHLMRSIISNNKVGFDYFLKKTVDLEEQDVDGYTALMYACFNNNIDMVKALHKQGCNLNTQDKIFGGTALHITIRENNEEIINYLLDNGADIQIKDDGGRNAILVCAKRSSNFEIFKKILKLGGDINEVDKVGDTPIFSAARFNSSVELLEEIIKSGGDINHVNENGNSIIHEASMHNRNPEIIQYLVDKGISPSVRNIDGNTTLMLAAQYNNYDVMEMLLRLGADINVRNKYGSTVIMTVLLKSKTDKAVNILLDYQPNLFEFDKKGETVLDYAHKNKYINYSWVYWHIRKKIKDL